MQHLEVAFQEFRTKSIRKKLKQIEDMLKEEARWDSSRDSINANRSHVQQRNQLLLIEETMWHQRSHVLCLNHGDENTKFFHGKVEQR